MFEDRSAQDESFRNLRVLMHGRECHGVEGLLDDAEHLFREVGPLVEGR